MFHNIVYKFIKLGNLGCGRFAIIKNFTRTFRQKQTFLFRPRTYFRPLFKSQQRLKFCIFLSILHALRIFLIYQTIHFLPNKYEPLPIECRGLFLCNSEDNNVSSAFSDKHFRLVCVNVAAIKSTRAILIIREISWNHQIYEKKITDRKRDVILCIMIPWCAIQVSSHKTAQSFG